MAISYQIVPAAHSMQFCSYKRFTSWVTAFSLSLFLLANSAEACTNITAYRIDPVKRRQQERAEQRQYRKHVKELFVSRKNVAMLRAIEEIDIGSGRRRLTYTVERIWKGDYLVGDKVQTEFPAVSSVFCDMPVAVGNLIFDAFDAEPKYMTRYGDDLSKQQLEVIDSVAAWYKKQKY